MQPKQNKTEGERNVNMESLYEYGSRAGFWRLHRLFTKKKVPCTVFAVGMVRFYLCIFQFVVIIYIWDICFSGIRIYFVQLYIFEMLNLSCSLYLCRISLIVFLKYVLAISV